jgi:DNA-binding response OmpR family regulator
MFLESRDYQVDVAADGEEALHALSKKRYELLITDHLMPKLSGVDLVRRLRANGNHIPAILISGDMPVHEPDLRQLFSEGALLAKPFSMSRFLEAVDATLGVAQKAA